MISLKPFSCDLRQSIRCILCKMLMCDFMVQAVAEASSVSLTHPRAMSAYITVTQWNNTHTCTRTHKHERAHTHSHQWSNYGGGPGGAYKTHTNTHTLTYTHAYTRTHTHTLTHTIIYMHTQS